MADPKNRCARQSMSKAWAPRPSIRWWVVKNIHFHFVRRLALSVAAFGLDHVVVGFAGYDGCIGVCQFLNQFFVHWLRGIVARFLSSIEVVTEFCRTRFLARAWIPG